MANKKFNYSKALLQLSKIIEALEEGKIPIEKLHKEVAIAQDLLTQCKAYLRKIEDDVNQILDEED